MRCLRSLAPALVPVALLLAVTTASAEERWAVETGRVVFHFSDAYMELLGLTFADVQETGAIPEPSSLNMEPPYRSFGVTSSSGLTFGVNHGSFVPGSFDTGALAASGGFALVETASGVRQELRDFTVEPTEEGDAFRVRDGASGQVVFDLQDPKTAFEPETARLGVAGMTVAISPEFAARIGRSDLAGRGVGVALLETEGVWVSGDSEGEPYQAQLTGTFKDVSLGILNGIIEWDRQGAYPNGISGISMATTSCNLGDVDVPWLAPMQEDHPGIAMSLFRLMDGRLEQVGISYVKHGFYALSSSQCIPCQHPSPGTFLGVGCSDTYGSGNNADRNYLGPRTEWDPYAGTWECTGSHFSGGVSDCSRRHGSGGHDATQHRLEVRDSDLNNPGAVYYYEAYYMVRGDQNKINNVGSRSTTMTWNGSAWNFNDGSPLVHGPTVDTRWDGDVSWVATAGGSDGQVVLSVKVTDLGGGQYNYEYALYNFDSQRRVRSFTVPVGQGTVVGNFGFHDPDLDAGNDWSVSLVNGSLTWSTGTYGAPGANPLEPGYMFNFRFDADRPPTGGQVSMGLYTPGTPSSTVATTTIPQAPATDVSPLEIGSRSLRLAQNSPNPLHSSTTIRFELPASSPVHLDIYDTEGRRVRSLVDGSRSAGIHDVRWDSTDDAGNPVAPGVYYYRLQAAGDVQARSMIVVP